MAFRRPRGPLLTLRIALGSFAGGYRSGISEAGELSTWEMLLPWRSRNGKPRYLLADYSGLRLRDEVGLSWENVNFELRQIRYFPRKANRGLARRPDWKKHVSGQLEVPLMPEMEAHLLSLPSSDDPAAKLCPTLASKGTGGNRGLSSMSKVLKLWVSASLAGCLGGNFWLRGRSAGNGRS